MNCYRVIFSAIKVSDSTRNAVEKSLHVVAETPLVASAYVEREQLSLEGVDEVHLQQVVEVAKNVLIADVITEPAAVEQLAADHPQMSGVIP